VIAVLFARSDSIYKSIPGCDVFDFERDALSFKGGMPVIAHPPCRSWGRLAHMAKPRPGERELALWAVDQVRRWGGVLEHPAGSRLWKEKPLPEPGETDEWGGFTLVVSQWWFGHRCEKMTRLYVCGTSMKDVPVMGLKLGEPEYVIAQSRKNKFRKKEVGKAEREHTPEPFAKYLIEIASMCRPQEVEAA
jgi:hypothetical protein